MNVHSKNRRATVRGRGRPGIEGVRQRILDAALLSFAERGYHGTSVPELAHAAHLSVGTLYHYFASKEQLVNEVYRDAKTRLRTAMLGDLDADQTPRELFIDVWRRLVAFARAQPIAFQFLELQDHVPYLDAKSRALELGVLAPIWQAAAAFQRTSLVAMPVEATIAFVWGSLVGLIKADRLGYLKLSDATLERAGEACWAAITASRRQT